MAFTNIKKKIEKKRKKKTFTGYHGKKKAHTNKETRGHRFIVYWNKVQILLHIG